MKSLSGFHRPTVYSLNYDKRCNILAPYADGKSVNWNLLLLTLLLTCCDCRSSTLRYSEQSCIDLKPRSADQYKEPDYNYFFGFERQQENHYRKGKRHVDYDVTPYQLNVVGRRYRRNSDLIVRVEGAEFEGLLLQSRITASGEFLRGGIGLVGSFRFLPSLFMYLPCFDLPQSSVVDRGRPVKQGNVSFIWKAPDQESGDIRFIASVLKGQNYWIIVSNPLSFNPFPISTARCGTSSACFRICPLEGYCGAREALLVMQYNVEDFRDKRELEFTMGGKLTTNDTYLAVAFSNDYNELIGADLTVCYLERGRAKIKHLLIENLNVPPYDHNEILELEDFDLDGNMLWCRYRRFINPNTIINPRTPVYHFYFRGNRDHYTNNFVLPRRDRIYHSSYMRNFSFAVNEIVSSANAIQFSAICINISIVYFTICFFLC